MTTNGVPTTSPKQDRGMRRDAMRPQRRVSAVSGKGKEGHRCHVALPALIPAP